MWDLQGRVSIILALATQNTFLGGSQITFQRVAKKPKKPFPFLF